MTSNPLRTVGLWALALLLTPGLAPTLGWAEDFPSPKEPPVPPAAEEGWSKPKEAAASAPAGQATQNLPPPTVIRRRSSTPQPRSAQPSATQSSRARAAPTTVSRVRSAPTQAVQRGTKATGTVEGGFRPVSSTRTATGASTVTRVASTPTCRILSIKKTHNVQSDTVEAGGPLFLQLDVEYEVIGQQGRDVFVAVWFARADDGKLIQSLTHDYRDSAGNVTIQTRWSRVMGARMTYAATLQIPYYTFPAHETGESYEIDARVQVLRNEAQRGRVSLLARDKTTFRVFGMSAEERDRANARNARFRDGGLDTHAFASPGLGEINEVGIPEGRGATNVAGETGTILTPGIQDGSGPRATPGTTGVINDLPTKGNAGSSK